MNRSEKLRGQDLTPSLNTVLVELDATNERVLGDYLDQLNSGQDVPRWHIVKLAAAAKRVQSGGAELPNSQAELQSASIVRALKAPLP